MTMAPAAPNAYASAARSAKKRRAARSKAFSEHSDFSAGQVFAIQCGRRVLFCSRIYWSGEYAGTWLLGHYSLDPPTP